MEQTYRLYEFLEKVNGFLGNKREPIPDNGIWAEFYNQTDTSHLTVYKVKVKKDLTEVLFSTRNMNSREYDTVEKEWILKYSFALNPETMGIIGWRLFELTNR